MQDIKKTDEAALALYKKNPAKALKMLTDYSWQAGANTFKTWKDLYAYLFTKYMDGNIKTPVAGQRNPKVEQPGYGEDWYRLIIKETGDKFRYQGEAGH